MSNLKFWGLLAGASVLVLVFLGGYMLGHDVSNKDLHRRVSSADSQLVECKRELKSWCASGRIRAGMCGKHVHMCMCVSGKEIDEISIEEN